MAICRHCGSPTVILGAKFCPECGKQLPRELNKPSGGNSPSADTVGVFRYLGAFFGFFGGGLVGLALSFTSSGWVLDGALANGSFLGAVGGAAVGFLAGSFVGGVVAGLRGE
jgi:hypothetical protein